LLALLSCYFGEDAPEGARQEVVEALLRDDPGFSRELVDGVMLVNARSEHVHRQLVFVGTSLKGFETEAKANAPVHLVLVAISPDETSLQEHLALFSELGSLATRVIEPGRLAQLETATEVVEELKRLARDPQAVFPDARDGAVKLDFTRTEI